MTLTRLQRIVGIAALNIVYVVIIAVVNYGNGSVGVSVFTEKSLDVKKAHLRDDAFSNETADAGIGRGEKVSQGVDHNFKRKTRNTKESSANNKSNGSTDESILLDIAVSGTGATLAVNGEEVYSVLNKTIPWGNDTARLHAGIHLVTLHQVTGKVMRSDLFMTWQPTSGTQFVAQINNTQDERLLVIMGSPKFLIYLTDDTLSFISDLGSDFVESATTMEPWCFVLHKGGRVWHEAITTSVVTPEKLRDVPPLSVSLAVPRLRDRQCEWYNEAHMTERVNFCETYEGYDSFCRCEGLPWIPDPKEGPDYPINEVIPVAIVTARRLPHVLKQVAQVWASPGGKHTPITLFVDGRSSEARALASLLKVSLVEHENQVPMISMSRINSHIKFTLEQVFKEYPEADKAIILEDDLDLAPDFIPFFQQTAPLLGSDPELVCVNAYNYNAFEHTVHDLSRLYRVHGVPAYGWMVRKTVAQEMVNMWPAVNQTVDWDLWLRVVMLGDRNILIPEIPRTKHVGGGGVHVTGLEQAVYYNKRPLSTALNVTLDVKGAEEKTYMKTHTDVIRSAEVVRFKEHPCKVLPIPKYKVNRTFVVYMDQPDENENYNAYHVIARCLGFNDRDLHENLLMMYTAPFYGNQLYLVGCPYSPFCLTDNPEDLYRPSPEDVKYANNNPFRKVNLTSNYAIRIKPLSFSEEINLGNVVNYQVKVG